MIQLHVITNPLPASGNPQYLEQLQLHHAQLRLVFKQLQEQHVIIFQALMELNTQFVI